MWNVKHDRFAIHLCLHSCVAALRRAPQFRSEGKTRQSLQIEITGSTVKSHLLDANAKVGCLRLRLAARSEKQHIAPITLCPQTHTHTRCVGPPQLLTFTASVARPDSRYVLIVSGSRGSAPLVCWAVTVKSTFLIIKATANSRRAPAATDLIGAREREAGGRARERNSE